MSKEDFPLFPELPAPAQEEAQSLINKFKESIKVAAEEAIGDLYCDVAVYMESDAWGNFRNEIMAGFNNYDNRKIQGEYDFKEIRQSILANHREDIIEDLNQDMLGEIKTLKEHIRRSMDEANRHRF